MVHLVMRGDGLTPDDVRTVFEEVRERQRLRIQTNTASRTTVKVDKENQDVSSPLCKFTNLCEDLLPLTGTAAALLILLALLPTLR